jgi:integrase
VTLAGLRANEDVFPASEGGYVDLCNWRVREWYPALEAAGIAKCGPYQLRHTFATEALAAGVSIFELAVAARSGDARARRRRRTRPLRPRAPSRPPQPATRQLLLNRRSGVEMASAPEA